MTMCMRAVSRTLADLRFTARWKKESKAFIELNPECVICGTDENLSVDHIQPYSKRPDLFWDIENWQVMCKTHNTQKGDRVTGQVNDWINKRWIDWEKEQL